MLSGPATGAEVADTRGGGFRGLVSTPRHALRQPGTNETHQQHDGVVESEAPDCEGAMWRVAPRVVKPVFLGRVLSRNGIECTIAKPHEKAIWTCLGGIRPFSSRSPDSIYESPALPIEPRARPTESINHAHDPRRGDSRPPRPRALTRRNSRCSRASPPCGGRSGPARAPARRSIPPRARSAPRPRTRRRPSRRA